MILFYFPQMAMVTWGVGSAVLGPDFCPSFCKSVSKAKRKLDGEDIADRFFEYTGVYVSEDSILAPVILTARILGGLVIPSEDDLEGTGSFCPAMCSPDLAKAVTVTGCGTALMGALDTMYIADYVTSNVIFPVSSLTHIVFKKKKKCLCLFLFYLGLNDNLGNV